MAEIYGRLTGRAGVCSATLGPGAINLLLGMADATTNSTPLVALSAQVGLNRIYKESHQSVDLVSMFAPVTKWADMVLTPPAVPEMVRKAFKLAQTERPGAVYLAVPEDVEAATVSPDLVPLAINVPRPDEPSPSQIERAAAVLDGGRNGRSCSPVTVRPARGAAAALRRFSETLGLAVATTFHGKGVFPDDHPNALGAVGFMRHDYVNFGFDEADVIVSVGYELQEFDPGADQPAGRQEHHPPEPAPGRGRQPLRRRGRACRPTRPEPRRAGGGDQPGDSSRRRAGRRSAPLVADELAGAAADDSFPAQAATDRRRHPRRPRRATTSSSPTRARSRCGWPGSIRPTSPTPACCPTGSRRWRSPFPGPSAPSSPAPTVGSWPPSATAPSSCTPRRSRRPCASSVPLTVLIWQDDAYGLIKWKMDLELGHDVAVDFTNPDFVAYAESFGARGYRIGAAGELLPALARGPGLRHSVGDRLSRRLLGEPPAHRRPRRADRAVLTRHLGAALPEGPDPYVKCSASPSPAGG